MVSLFARSEHGGHRVTPLPQGFQVEWPEGVRQYPSARQLVLALVNQTPAPPPKAYDPHLTFDRYFRTGKYQKPIPAIDTLTLFQKPEGLAVVAVTSPPVSTTKKGFDVSARLGEVRKLFYAGFARKVVRMGYDPEDVLQEVYAGILVRNKGICPFDAEKSSFGHYVHMICGCILSNYHRKHSRISSNETYGVSTVSDETVDVAAADIVSVEADQDVDLSSSTVENLLAKRMRVRAPLEKVEAENLEECFRWLAKGYRTKEISDMTGLSIGQVTKHVKIIRALTRTWATSQGLR